MAGQPYAIRWLRRTGEIPEALWERCFPPPLEGRWWYEALERAGLESQFEFLYGLIESRGEAVGIAPAFLMDLPLDLVAPDPIARLLPYIPPLRSQRTLFAGSPCADEGTVGLLPGVALGEVAPAIQAALEEAAAARRCSMVVWKDFPETDWGALESLSRERGLFRVISFPNTRMEVGECRNFDDYLKTLNADHRRVLKKKLRRSHALGELEVSVAQRPGVAELEEIFGLFWQTYNKGKTKFERLTPEFFHEIARAEPAWFVMLRDPAAGGRMVAFNLVFLLGRRLINKFIGLDYAYGGEWYLYFRLWEALASWGTGLGAREFQSGQTGYTAKLDIGYKPKPLNNYCRHRNRLLNAALGRVARCISWNTLDEDLAPYVKAHGLPPAYGGAAPRQAPESLRKAA